MIPLKRWFRSEVLALKAYAPGEQPASVRGVVKLNTNENPYPPSPAVRRALGRFDPSDLRRYPDPTCRALRRRIAELERWDENGIVVANGSDEFLALLFRAAVGRGDLVQWPDVTYSLYPVLNAERGGRLRTVALDPDFRLDFRMLDPKARLTLLGFPNAPIGNLFALSDLESFARRARGLVLVDEAYGEFSGQTCLPVARRNPNVLVLRTLSKSFSLAGLRLGYAFAHPSVAGQLHKVRDSYNVDRLAQALAEAALSDAGLRHARRNLEAVRRERERLREALLGLGFEVPGSSANFLLARPPGRPTAQKLYKSLKATGVLVRYFPLPRLEDRLRITVGTPAQDDRLIGALKALRSASRRSRS